MTGVVVFAAVLIALLAIPVSLRFQVSWPDGESNDIELSWAFGLVRKHIRPSEAESDTSEIVEREPRKKRSKSRGRSDFSAIRALRQREFRRRIGRFISDVWCAVHKEDVQLRLRIGLGDPAATGELWAFLGPLAGILGASREVSLIVKPEFIDEILELDGHGCVRVIPLQLLYHVASLMLSPAIWRGLRQARAPDR